MNKCMNCGEYIEDCRCEFMVEHILRKAARDPQHLRATKIALDNMNTEDGLKRD